MPCEGVRLWWGWVEGDRGGGEGGRGQEEGVHHPIPALLWRVKAGFAGGLWTRPGVDHHSASLYRKRVRGWRYGWEEFLGSASPGAAEAGEGEGVGTVMSLQGISHLAERSEVIPFKDMHHFCDLLFPNIKYVHLQ